MLKRSYTVIKWDSSQGSKDFSASTNYNVIHCINKLKDKYYMITSIDTEKSFDKIQHPFMIKKLSRKWAKRVHTST